jgi:hypothetical protein
MKEREARRAHLKAELAKLGSRADITSLNAACVSSNLRERLTDWQGLLQRHTVEARQILRRLLVGRLLFTPKEDEKGRYYEFAGQGSVSELLSGVVLPKVWWPQEDSNPWFSHDHVFARDRRTLRLAWFRRCRSTAYCGTHPPQESPGTAIGRRPMMSWRNGGPGHQGRRADATDGHDRRPRRHPADPRPSRAPGCEGRPAGPVLRCCGASRAAGREPGRPWRSVLSAPVDGARAAPRGSGLTCPARSDRIGARCHGSSAQWYGKSRPGNRGRMIVLDKWAAPRLNGITFGPPDSVRRWSIATPRRLTHE